MLSFVLFLIAVGVSARLLALLLTRARRAVRPRPGTTTDANLDANLDANHVRFFHR